MGVGGDQLDAVQAAGDQATQEPGPDRAVLGCADVEPEDLPMPVGVAGGGDQHRGVADPPALADLHRQRIDPQEGIGAGVQGPVTPGIDQLIQLAADPRHLRLGDAVDAHRPGHVLDPPGRHSFHIALGHHRGQGPLGAAAWLQQAREVAALA
jgi:hypothetical protein